MRVDSGSHVVSGTMATNASSTHDAHYAMPYQCHFENHCYDCIDIHDAHYTVGR
jgi:hypothetical protein